MTKEEILKRNFKLELGTRMREAMPPGSPAKSAQDITNLKLDILREFMSREEEGSLAMSVLQRMLESIQNRPSNDYNADYAEEVIEPPVPEFDSSGIAIDKPTIDAKI
jgi:hypothetical protein